jgi:cell division protein FtsL
VAKRRSPGRGRALVGVLLCVFVLVASGVIWRRSYGIRQATELDRMSRQLTELRAERTNLERDIRIGSSRPRIVPIAEQRLQMKTPDERHVILLPRSVERHAR